MNYDFIRAWIDALRSGEYKQTTGRLRNCYGYCALGVGCDVARKMGLTYFNWELLSTECSSVLHDHYSFGGLTGQPPSDIENLYKKPQDDVYMRTITNRIMNWNDELELSFEQIANALEAEYFPKNTRSDNEEQV